MSLRSHSMPCASIFAHCAAVSLIERCSSFASGGAGGRPRGRFGSSITRLYVMQKTLAQSALLNHNKPSSQGAQMTLYIVTRNGNPVGVSFGKTGLEALRTVQRTSGLEGRLSGGWMASPVHSAVPVPSWKDAACACLAEGRSYEQLGMLV